MSFQIRKIYQSHDKKVTHNTFLVYSFTNYKNLVNYFSIVKNL